MKHTLLCSLLAFNSLIAEDEKIQPGKNFTVHISTKSSSYSKSSNGIEQSRGHYQQPHRTGKQPPTYLAIPLHTLQQPATNFELPTQDGNVQSPVYFVTPQQEATPSYRSNAPSFSNISTFIKNTFSTINPVTITIGALLAVYAVYQIKMYNLSHYALKRNTWSTWKEHIPLEVMIEVPHQEVAEELFNTIKSTYLPANNTDMMTPMVKFNNAVDRELNKLNKFLQLHEWLSYTKLSYLFPGYEKEIATAKVKIKRLVFFKDVLHAWINDYSTEIIHDKFVPRLSRIQAEGIQETDSGSTSMMAE